MRLDLALVQNEVNEQISQGNMFTAYDITKALRKAGVWCKHYEVKDEVHNLFHNGSMGGDWRRTNVLVSSNCDYAWLYHHYMDDPNDYVNPSVSPANANSVTNVTPPKTPVASVVVPASVGKSTNAIPAGPYVKYVDNRHRLLIEKRYISALGLTPGDEAYVYLYSGKSVEICIGTYTGGTLLNVYSVDRDGAVRLGSRVLKELGDLDHSYLVTADSNGITITK